jgi:hypothetical protein
MQIKNTTSSNIKPSKVYLIQDIPVDRETGKPKYNVLGAQKYGDIVTMLPVYSQIILSPGPMIFELRNKLKDFTTNDYLLLSGDPAIIGVVCSIVSDITNGRYKLLKWDRQEKTYYPIEINIFQK